MGTGLRECALTLDFAEKPFSDEKLGGRCLQRLDASETPLGAASDSPPGPIRPVRFFSGIDSWLL